jgi:hypothetical protein
MSDVHFRIETGWGTCDDCGSYDWSYTTMHVDGHEVRSWNYDGHLGGGIRFDEPEAVMEVLKALGHNVTIEETHRA